MSPATPAGLSAMASCWQTTQRTSLNRAWARASWLASAKGRSGAAGGSAAVSISATSGAASRIAKRFMRSCVGARRSRA